MTRGQDAARWRNGEQVEVRSPVQRARAVMPASFKRSTKYCDQPTRRPWPRREQLEDQVPADDPGDDLAERRVGERVGRPGDRHGARELGVAERGQRADRRRRTRTRARPRARLGAGRFTGQDEDAGPDDDADTEDGEVERAEAPCELLALFASSVSRIDCSMILVRNASSSASIRAGCMPWAHRGGVSSD